jgi:hypothetical protein
MICGASSSSSDRTARRNEQFSSRFNLIIESVVDRIEVDDHCRCSKIRTDSTNRASEWAAFRQKLSEAVPRKLNPHVLMVQSPKHGSTFDASDALNDPSNRRILP